MASSVIFTDVELFLAHHIKDRLDAIAAGPPGLHQALAADVYVGNQHPPTRRPKSVVVRDDGGPTTGIVTAQTSAGFTVLAGDDDNPGKEATDLALLVAAIVAGSPGTEPGNPVAAVLTMNGPFKVADPSGQPRRYFTASLAVTGEEFTL
ncbi:hypothetical protein [Arthrobacter sp. UYCu712]|uniref:hypothetical protein n=1 Tax=Arthrobacter sp. UYCu712 TaxID=3156340 RepID=UPI0033918FF4